ncbi:MAG: ComEC/Rec2 family competence protein [Verrucomicrobia bacterium]|nr:ComEC/Rec2 family competence protein [Verrucomicrobiota bacterium]
MNWSIKRPFVPVTLAYVGGLLLAEFVSLPLLWLLGLAGAVALLALVWAGRRLMFLWPLIFLAGAANLTLHTAVRSPDDLRVILGQRTELAVLRGRLAETPYHRVYDQNAEPAHRTLAQIEVAAVKIKNQPWQPATGRVAISAAGILPDSYHAGQTVEVAGVLQPPRTPVAEGLFDYRAFLRHNGIYYQLQAFTAADWKIIPPAVPPPVADRFFGWAKNILRLDLPAEDEPLRLLWTMTLGWKSALTGEVAEPFMRSGTMHIFAISGLHIALIAGILVALLRVLRVPRGVCGFVVIPLIWFYTGVTGWQASAIRSTVMMTVVIAGWALRRPSDLLNSLAAAAGIILVWQPQQIFQASFQLSFFVVLSIALFSPVLEQVRQRWLQADPLVPEESRPRWQRWLKPVGGWLATGFTTSLAAWLGSIPLIAYYFHLFTPVSLLANLIVVPLSSLALASNLASLIVGGWWPGLAGLFNHSSWLWMLLMERVSEWAAWLPGGCFQIGTPSALSFAIYYTMLLAVMAGW